jgi:2,4-dienoyl-CoA reductase-like NADH-dependent reductase (Old Yellow Enzyme family)
VTPPKLFEPLTSRGTVLKNRIVVSPMCQYMARDGYIQPWHLAHHSRFALGGAGTVFVEATAVTRDGRITHGCTGIWDDGQIAGLKQIVELHRAHGVTPAIQIGHAGRRASAARPWEGAKPLALEKLDAPWQTVGPSAIPERDGYPVPRELTSAEIDDIVEAFVSATKRAQAAGFEIVEVHGAHGYLLHSFFSPISNRRNDAYGGSREKRMRVPLIVAEAVRKAWPSEKPVFYRASVIDGVDGGLTIEDTVALARELKSLGIDLIDCSSGGMSGPATLSTKKIKPGYQVPFAEAVRQGAQMPVMAVGAIIDGPQAEAILAEGKADLIAIAREMLADPNWTYHAAVALGLVEPWSVLPNQYGFYLERRAAVLER